MSLINEQKIRKTVVHPYGVAIFEPIYALNLPNAEKLKLGIKVDKEEKNGEKVEVETKYFRDALVTEYDSTGQKVQETINGKLIDKKVKAGYKELLIQFYIKLNPVNLVCQDEDFKKQAIEALSNRYEVINVALKNNLVNKGRSGKYQYVNEIGEIAWATDEDSIKMGNGIDKMTTKKGLRKAFEGEGNLQTTLNTIFGFDAGTICFKEEDIKVLLTGNIKPLQNALQQIKEYIKTNKRTAMCAGLYSIQLNDKGYANSNLPMSYGKVIDFMIPVIKGINSITIKTLVSKIESQAKADAPTILAKMWYNKGNITTGLHIYNDELKQDKPAETDHIYSSGNTFIPIEEDNSYLSQFETSEETSETIEPMPY